MENEIIMTPLYRIYNKETNQYIDYKLFVSISGYVASNVYETEEQEEFIIERCTGMQDIKGVRMYEGDVVTFGLDYKDIKYTLILEGLQWKIFDSANLKYVIDGKDLEVVGNIHS